MADKYTPAQIAEEYGEAPEKSGDLDFYTFEGDPFWYYEADCTYCVHGGHYCHPDAGTPAEIDGEAACPDCLGDYLDSEDYVRSDDGYRTRSMREQHGYPF